MEAALAFVFGMGVCSFPFLRLPRPARAAALISLAVPVLLAPLLVPLPLTGLRFIVSLISIMLGVKLYDLHQVAESGPPPRVLEFLAYLLNGCSLVLRRVTAQRPPSRRADIITILWRVPITLACAFTVPAVWRFDWRPYPWLLEHCVKVVAVCAFIQFGFNIISSIWRLMGLPASDFSGWFIAAATPAEFWRRWNKPAGQFFYEYAFVPAGGPRRFFLAVLATFAINGLLHEYVFDVPAGRLLGLALIFFLIQGFATAATLRLRPKGWRRALGILLTLIFNFTTSLLLFACVDAVLPFYAARGN